MRASLVRNFLFIITVVIFSMWAALPARADAIDDAIKLYEDGLKDAKACCVNKTVKAKLKDEYEAQIALDDLQNPWPDYVEGKIIQKKKGSDEAIKAAKEKLEAAQKVSNDAAGGEDDEKLKCYRKALKKIYDARQKAKDNWGIAGGIRQSVNYQQLPAAQTKYRKAVTMKSANIPGDLALATPSCQPPATATVPVAVPTTPEVTFATPSLPAPSSTVLYVGGDLNFTVTSNKYADFPSFSSLGVGAGGHVGLRQYFQNNAFAGVEVGWIGTNIRGQNPDGAFANYDWQAWQMAQLGVTVQPPKFAAPVTAYIGFGATEGRIVVGQEAVFIHESMSDVMTGAILRAGFEIYVASNVTVGASFDHSWFNGSIGGDPVKTQLNSVRATLNYSFTPRF